MKKYLLFVILFSQTVLMAQGLRLGIIAGVNNETRTSKGHNFNFAGRETEFKSENSYNYGLVGVFKLFPSLNVNTSLMFTRKKVSTVWSGPADGPVEAKLYFDYISLSPKLEYNPFLGLYINAGPSLDLKINTKLEQRGAYVEDSDEIAGTNDLRFGMLFSLGYRLDFLNNSALAAEVSYDVGLTDTNSRYGGKYSTSRAALIFFFR